MRFTFWTIICSLLLLAMMIEDSTPIYIMLTMCFIISCLQINAFSKAVESDKMYSYKKHRGLTKGELNKKYKYQVIFWGISFFGFLIYGFISLIIFFY